MLRVKHWRISGCADFIAVRLLFLLFNLAGEIPDSFFEVSVDDIRVMLRDLKSERY